ncbi:c-type cytochrome [Hyphomonas sp.]|uniref:c-type cytochrome n=1 Tax=Hyphomonas sp. TaxID=87 RepID=UPI003918BDE9
MRLLTLTAAALILSAAACAREEAPPPLAPPEPPAEVAATGPMFDAEALGIPYDEASISDGKAIAQSHCAICHGLNGDDSLRGDAPPLRYVLSLYPPENLAEDFRAGIHVGHQDMPDFVFGPLGMDVLLAYLISIQETPPG